MKHKKINLFHVLIDSLDILGNESDKIKKINTSGRIFINKNQNVFIAFLGSLGASSYDYNTPFRINLITFQDLLWFFCSLKSSLEIFFFNLHKMKYLTEKPIETKRKVWIFQIKDQPNTGKIFFELNGFRPAVHSIFSQNNEIDVVFFKKFH